MPRGVGVQVPMPAPWRVFLQHLKGCRNTRFLYSEFTGAHMFFQSIRSCSIFLRSIRPPPVLSIAYPARSTFSSDFLENRNFFKRLSTRFYNFSDFRRLHGYLEDTAITKIYVLSIFILYESDTIHSALKKSGDPCGSPEHTSGTPGAI